MLTKGLVSNVLIAIGIILLITGSLLFLQNNLSLEASGRYKGTIVIDKEFSLDYQRLVSEKKRIRVVIPQGTSSLEVANILEDKGLVEAEDFKKLYLLFPIESKIKAGEYYFYQGASLADILDKILIK